MAAWLLSAHGLLLLGAKTSNWMSKGRRRARASVPAFGLWILTRAGAWIFLKKRRDYIYFTTRVEKPGTTSQPYGSGAFSGEGQQQNNPSLWNSARDPGLYAGVWGSLSLTTGGACVGTDLRAPGGMRGTEMPSNLSRLPSKL